MSSKRIYDLAVIGGGINGCGIARDAAGRGISTFLCEQGDLAQGTSSASTKLIHGGLRYLEYYEFRLVREALIEREVLLRAAPHIIRPMRFVLPHAKGLRPAWMLRLGLFLYDHLGGREILPGTRTLDLAHGPFGAPLRHGFKKGFEYSDCWVEDARLVALNAADAARRGAEVRTRTRCERARRDGDLWVLSLTCVDTGRRFEIRARALVNAAGPWVGRVIEQSPDLQTRDRIRLVRGSHVVVRRMFDHDQAYIFQNPDGRIFFAIPYERDFTLIGTTDQDHEGDPGKAEITEAEIAYLCEAASGYFREAVTPDDVVWSYSGVRPLYDDGAKAAQEATRDYVLKRGGGAGEAPVINIFGGKITTYRKLAEAVLAELASVFPALGKAWTAGATLPGGDFEVDGRDDLIRRLGVDFPFIDRGWARRLVETYGTLAWSVLGEAKEPGDLGKDFGATLTEREVDYLIESEWARTAEDVLWRRTKLGLQMSEDQKSTLDTWMRAKPPVTMSAA